MELSEVAKTISKYAPVLGTVLPIPGGMVLGQLIASLFGGNINNPDDLLKRIQSDPDAKFKLTQFELQHKLEIEKIALQHFQAEISDRANARQRETELTKIDPNNPNLRVMRNLSYIIVLGFLAALFMLFFPQININETEKTLLAGLIGMLATCFRDVCMYYFSGVNTQRNN